MRLYTKSVAITPALLRPAEDVADNLVLAEERDVPQDLEGLRVHELRLAALVDPWQILLYRTFLASDSDSK